MLAVAVNKMGGRVVNELTHIDTVKWRQVSWNILLAVWWGLQQRNGIAHLHRKRGVPLVSPEDIDLERLMIWADEIDTGQAEEGASSQHGMRIGASIDSGSHQENTGTVAQSIRSQRRRGAEAAAVIMGDEDEADSEPRYSLLKSGVSLYRHSWVETLNHS